MRTFPEEWDDDLEFCVPAWEDLGWLHGRLRLEVDHDDTTWHVRAYYQPELRSGGSSRPYAEFDLPNGDGYPPKHFVLTIPGGWRGYSHGYGVIYEARALVGNVWRSWDFTQTSDMAGWRNHGLGTMRRPVAQQREGWPWTTEPPFDPLATGLLYCASEEKGCFSRIARTEEGELFAMHTDGMGVTWNARLDPNDRIIVEHRDQTDYDAAWIRTAVVDESGQYGTPQITGDDRELIVSAMRYDRVQHTWYSVDGGESWDGPHVVSSAEV